MTRAGAAAGAARRAKPLRLDERLVRDGLAESRSRAEALIRTGRVLVGDVPVEKPGTRVRDEATVRLRGEERRFASRGGEKLAGALADLGAEPRGLVCLDVGASSGGFTDCLLQAGAQRVVALDVGHGQLDSRLRGDPRVAVLERSNARTVPAAAVREAAGAEIRLVVMDVSFISATLLLPRVAEFAPRAELLVLVKPQFEVGREQVGKGGVVRDDGLRAAAVDRVREAARAAGYEALGEAESRLAGPKGNREVFLRLAAQRGPDWYGLTAGLDSRLMSVVSVTESAAQQIKRLLDQEGKAETHALRMKVVGGGCSGLQYQLAFDDQVRENDAEIEANGVRVRIDEKSALYLVGTTLDYVDTLMESGFKIQNPNAKSTCGCGQSFGA